MFGLVKNKKTRYNMVGKVKESAMIRDKIEETIQQYRLILPGERIGVAVSGGVDSMVLLHVLENLAPRLEFSLVRIPYEEAEVLKTTPEKEDEIFPVIKAVIEKMATITEKFLHGYQVPAVYVVGGSASFREFTTVFEKKLGLPVYRPVHPLLVTPLGIAYYCDLPPVTPKKK